LLNYNDLPYFVRKNAQEIILLTFYNDVLGEAIFSISYRFPREITQKGLTSINYPVSLILGAALFVLIVLLLLLQTVIVKPLRKLTDHASRLEKEGDFSLRINLERSDEVGQLANTIDIMVETIAERTNALMEANTKLKQMSLVDGLTGIANRRRFDEDMAGEWRRMVRQNTPMARLMWLNEFEKRSNIQRLNMKALK
jgi:methyl-accepting chemotaxis protein